MARTLELLSSPQSLKSWRLLLLHVFNSLHRWVMSHFLYIQYVISLTQNLFQISKRVWPRKWVSLSEETRYQQGPYKKDIPSPFTWLLWHRKFKWKEAWELTDWLSCRDFSSYSCYWWPQVPRAPFKIDSQKPWPMASRNSKLLRATFLEEAHPCSLLLIYSVIVSCFMLGKWKQELAWFYYTFLDLWSNEFLTLKRKQCLRFLILWILTINPWPSNSLQHLWQE